MKCAYPKGEIFLGHTSSGFLVVHGFGPGFREQVCQFHIVFVRLVVFVRYL